MPFSRELTNRIDRILEGSDNKRSSLIAVLREVQNEYGWLSKESMDEVALKMDLPASNVQSVATFYTMFFTEPVGQHIIWLCRTLSCALKGAEEVEHYLSEKLGIKTGETTPDGRITLLEAECLASCGTAPAMLVDDTLYENLTREKIDKLIEKLRNE